jgi:C-terminal peptidase prc
MWYILLSLSLFLITACDNNTSNTTSFDPFEKTTDASDEFQFNYLFLYFYYYQASTELKDPEYYLDNVNPNIYISSVQDVADVLFMYEDMSDLFTNYYPSIYYEQLWAMLNESESNKTVGLAVDSTLTVKRVYPNSSAYNAEIQKGDIILAVDSIYLNGSYDRYEKLVDSSAATSFEFLCQRGGDTLIFDLQKTEILLPTVYLDSIDNVPVITLTEFTDSTSNENGSAAEFEEILQETQGALSTVLDLRDNPGGSVDQCNAMAAALLSKGDTIINEKYFGPDEAEEKQISSMETYTATEDGIGKGRYYVMLLDSNSASCSEIFASALASNLKTPIVGQLSYGKGIGQYYIVTDVNGIAGVTALNLFDKDMVSYHTYGIVPDFEITDTDAAMKKAVELAKARTYKRTAGYGTTAIAHWTEPKTKKQAGISSSLDNFKKDGAFKIKRLNFQRLNYSIK